MNMKNVLRHNKSNPGAVGSSALASMLAGEAPEVSAIGLRRTRKRSSLHHRFQRGSMLLEVTVGALMVGALLAVVSQVVVRLHRQTTLMDGNVAAQQALQNLMEEFIANEWTSIDDDGIASLSLPEETSRRLAGAELSGNIVDEDEPVIAKRITLQLRWKTTGAERKQELRLTNWIYQRQEAAP